MKKNEIKPIYRFDFFKVEIMLESLHDRRLFVEKLFQKSSVEVKELMNRSSIKQGLEHLGGIVKERMKELERYHQDLGSCVSSVEILMRKVIELEKEVVGFSGKYQKWLIK